GGDSPLCVGGSKQGHKAADEEADLGISGQQRFAQPIALGWSASTAWEAWLFLEHPRFAELFQVGAHRRRVDFEEAGKLGNLAWPFFEGLHDGQAAGV